MKKIILLIVLVIIIVVGIILLNKKKKENIKKEPLTIKHLYFYYSNGYSKDAYTTYRVDYKDDKYIAVIKPYEVPSEEEITIELDNDTINKLIDVLTKYEVVSWNKFDKHDKNVLDGDSFTFNLITKEDKEISARGYMRFPKNYRDVCSELEKIFKEIISSK